MRKILLVDDDAVTLEAYRKRLLQQGLEVDSAKDGIAALQVLHNVKPDLVVLDLMMPKFNGFEVLKYIRAQPDLKRMGVVVLSNYYSNDPAHQAAMEQADVTLLKSNCTPALLLETVNHLLTRASLLRSTSPPAAPTAPAETPETGEPQKRPAQFLKHAPVMLATLRQLNDAFAQSDSPETQGLRLLDFYQKVHAFTGLAATAGLESIAALSSAFEVLLSDLHQRRELITPSTLQTVAYTLEFFRMLLGPGAEYAAEVSLENSKALVVDDDAVSTHALIAALHKANLNAVGFQDPGQALVELHRESYNVVLLDIQMPGMDGFELCEKLRKLPQYARTPIIFVTGHTEFDNRIHSVLSGGNDLIAKPVFAIELAVKVLTHLLRSRLPNQWAA